MVVEKNENGHWSYKIQTLSHNILLHLWVAPTLQLTLLTIELVLKTFFPFIN